MVLMCQRLLPEAKRDIYLQGATSFTLSKKHNAVNLYCSKHNPGAVELALELNAQYGRPHSSRAKSGRLTAGQIVIAPLTSLRSSIRRSSTRRSSNRSSAGAHLPGQLLQVVADMNEADTMLLYLNARTWAHNHEALAADIREAQRIGVHLQLCHEFPSVIDPGLREALAFSEIMNATPPELKSGPGNVYKQIAIGLKGGELREVGLAALATNLVQCVPRAPIRVQDQDPASVNASTTIVNATPTNVSSV